MRAPLRSLLLLISILTLFGCKSETSYEVITGYAQGGTYNIRCNVPPEVSKSELSSLIDRELVAIDNSISGYNKGSVLSKVNAGENVPLDKYFVEVFNKSLDIWKLSGGAFDPSAGPLFSLWGYGFDKTSVDTTMIPSLKEHIGMDLFEIYEDSQGLFRLRKLDSQAQLNFNAIAQGYTCDVIGELLDELGCEDYLIEIGGEILCKGKSSRGDDWRIWIDKPVDGNDRAGALKQDILSISDCAVVTSGNYRKFYYENGVKYSHTINPLTGFPVRHSLLSATVVADNCADADAYATWFMVVGVEDAKRLAEALEVGVYLVYGEQENMSVWHTEGLKLDEEIKE
ncbi:MAG: FAD:protein FMN transferase [Bacteroidales bacterium]|nr:FAD:protein FMN transferase [Bacteroidales bacterium]